MECPPYNMRHITLNYDIMNLCLIEEFNKSLLSLLIFPDWKLIDSENYGIKDKIRIRSGRFANSSRTRPSYEMFKCQDRCGISSLGALIFLLVSIKYSESYRLLNPSPQRQFRLADHSGSSTSPSSSSSRASSACVYPLNLIRSESRSSNSIPSVIVFDNRLEFCPKRDFISSLWSLIHGHESNMNLTSAHDSRDPNLNFQQQHQLIIAEIPSDLCSLVESFLFTFPTTFSDSIERPPSSPPSSRSTMTSSFKKAKTFIMTPNCTQYISQQNDQSIESPHPIKKSSLIRINAPMVEYTFEFLKTIVKSLNVSRNVILIVIQENDPSEKQLNRNDSNNRPSVDQNDLVTRLKSWESEWRLDVNSRNNYIVISSSFHDAMGTQSNNNHDQRFMDLITRTIVNHVSSTSKQLRGEFIVLEPSFRITSYTRM